MEQCVQFNIGKINVSADQSNLSFNEHRRVCNKDGDFSFEYGTFVEKSDLLFVGKSLNNEDKLVNYKFKMEIYVNDKKVGEEQIDYAQFVDLFTHDLKSKILSSTKKKYIRSPTGSPTG